MELWTMWTHLLEATIGSLAQNFGFSEAIGIIVFTLVARTVLMPLSLTAAYKMQKNKEIMNRIKPALADLRTTYKDNQAELAVRTMSLYRENGVKFIDKVSIINIGSQAVVGLGIFQTLKRMIFSSKFFWISNLAKPDFMLTVVVGVLMALGMALMPGVTADSSSLLMLVIPVIISVIAIAALPSALGIYWATSNFFTIVQTIALRVLLARRKHFATGSAA